MESTPDRRTKFAVTIAVAALAVLGCSGGGEPDSAAPPEVSADLRAHIDAHADLVQLESPEPLAVVESPLEVTGRARGTWYFEASFPVELVDRDGRVIAAAVATAEGEWMTQEFVPFRATLEFEPPAHGGRGVLILRKSNASGLPEHDDALEVTVRFGNTGGLDVVGS